MKVLVLEEHGVKRLVVMSALGVGETWKQTPWLPRLVCALLLREIFADKARGEEVVFASKLDWTVVYPPLLTDGPLKGRCRAGTTLELTGYPKISRADIAKFIVDSLAWPTWVRKQVLISD